MAQKTSISILPPLKGISRKFGYQQQPPYTTYESINVWPIDVVSGRSISATRPPLVDFTAPDSVGVVNLINRINGVAEGKPLQSMILAEDGQIHWWDGSAWVAATGAEAANTPQGIPWYGGQHLQKVFFGDIDGKPHVFDYPTGTVIELVETAGDVPTDCRMYASWQGALWMAGRLQSPHILYASRVGDPFDYNFAAPLADEGGAFFTGGDNEGLLNGPITAIMVHTKDSMIVSTTEGLVAFRGHPRITRYIENLGGAYVLGQGAFCKGPDDTLYMMTRLGMCTLAPTDGAVPVQVSRDVIPDRLIGLPYDYENPTISMEYDSLWNGIHISIRDIGESWWYDLDTGGFHEEEYADAPFVMQEFFPIQTENESAVLFGGDSFLKRHDRFGAEDNVNSRLVLGPFPISASPMTTTMMQKHKVTFGGSTPDVGGDGTYRVATGADSEDVINIVNFGMEQFTTDILKLKNNNGICYPRLTGAAGAIVIDITGGRFAYEQCDIDLVTKGINRMTRFPYSTVPCFGYMTATPQYAPASQKATATLEFEEVEGDSASFVFESDTYGTSQNGIQIYFTEEELGEFVFPSAAFDENGDIEVTISTNAIFNSFSDITTAIIELGYWPISESYSRDYIPGGNDGMVTGTFSGGTAGSAVSEGMEIVDMSPFPQEWWDQVVEEGNNIKLSDTANKFLAFDLIGLDLDNQTGSIVLKRDLPTTPEPVRCWVCDENTARFPRGSRFGQYNSYPPWMIYVWPGGFGNNRNRIPFTLDFDPFEPDGPETDPFNSDNPGMGGDDSECKERTWSGAQLVETIPAPTDPADYQVVIVPLVTIEGINPCDDIEEDIREFGDSRNDCTTYCVVHTASPPGEPNGPFEKSELKAALYDGLTGTWSVQPGSANEIYTSDSIDNFPPFLEDRSIRVLFTGTGQSQSFDILGLGSTGSVGAGWLVQPYVSIGLSPNITEAKLIELLGDDPDADEVSVISPSVSFASFTSSIGPGFQQVLSDHFASQMAGSSPSTRQSSNANYWGEWEYVDEAGTLHT